MQSCCISMELEEVEVLRSSFFRVHIVKLIQQDCCMVSVENEGVEKSVTFAFQIGRYRASSTRRMTITPAVMLFLPAWMKWWWWWHLYKWQHYSPRWWHFCKANKLYWLTQLLSDIQSLTISSIPTAEHAGCVYSLHLHVLFPYRDSRYWSDIDHIIKPSVKGVCVWPGIEMGSIKLGKIIFPYFSPYLPSGLKTGSAYCPSDGGPCQSWSMDWNTGSFFFHSLSLVLLRPAHTFFSFFSNIFRAQTWDTDTM